MPLEKPQVEQIARLAGLKLTPEETVRISGQLSLIVDFFDQLGEVDTSSVIPKDRSPLAANVLRQDNVRPSLSQQTALSQSNERDAEHFLVPKVLR